MDTLAISVFLIILEFVEIARLDKIMKTMNTSGHKSKKAAAACESSDDGEPLLSTDSSSEEDDYPDWRLMLKNVEGNPHLFKQTKFQLQLNELEKEYNPRIAQSCIEFNTGTDKQEDEREVRSFPPSPKMYADFKGIDVHNFGLQVNNAGTEVKQGKAGNQKEFSEIGTQFGQSTDMMNALARKGGDLVTPNLEKDDNNQSKRKTTKKKRGRKNKYYRQIDAEDDEEADQMTDGSNDDGLDGIKEEDEEDEEERLAKLARQKAELERLEALNKQKAEQERKKKEAEDQKKADEQ